MNTLITLSEALSIVNQFPVCWLATSDEGHPHVRGLLLWFADETGFYYHTASSKRLVSQLQKNPNVEIAFFDPGDGNFHSRSLRVAGQVEVLNDATLLERLYSERPWVRDNLARQFSDTTRVVIFRVPHGKIQYWTLAQNGQEADLEPIVF